MLDVIPNVITLVDDFMSEVWKDRGNVEFNTITNLPLEYCGEDTKSKYNRIKEYLGVNGEFIYPIVACDEVAWLCNIRGTDIEFNPLAQSYAAITNIGVKLFVDIKSLTKEVKEDLEANNVEIIQYQEWCNYLNSIPNNYLRVCLPSKISIRDYKLLDKGKFILAGITKKNVLQDVELAINMQKNGDLGISVPNYTDENVSVKVIKLIQSYTGVVDKMVWRKS